MLHFHQDCGFILIIHPQPNVCDWLQHILEGAGHTIVCEYTVEAGLERFRQDGQQLILVDLPLMQINELSEFSLERPDIPVVTVSKDTQMDTVLEGLKNGAIDHFFLDREKVVLLHTVQRALERGRLLKQNQEYQQQLEAANAELARSLETLQEDQEAGRRIQFRLLPQTPFQAYTDCTVTHRILPSLYLSGDFIDYFKIGEGKLGFYLADVSGHGAASAFVTVFLKAITNRIQKHYERKTTVNVVAPARILSMINDELIGARMGKHLAMFCGVIDFEHNRFTYSVAAHYPPPILVNNGRVMSLVGRGLPLGLFKEVHHEEHTMDLEPHFTFIATSDGVLDVLPKESAQDKEKRLQVMALNVNNVDDLVTELNLSEDVALPDDVALLVIHRV